MILPDLLHQLIKGTFKDHLVTWVCKYLVSQHGECRAGLILDDIDWRYMCLTPCNYLPLTSSQHCHSAAFPWSVPLPTWLMFQAVDRGRLQGIDEGMLSVESQVKCLISVGICPSPSGIRPRRHYPMSLSIFGCFLHHSMSGHRCWHTGTAWNQHH